MRTIEIQVFKFDELNNRAKERARDWWRSTDHYGWDEDSRHSISAFCSHFDVKLKEYDVDNVWFKHDATSATFRGCKLKDFKRDHMPTGYYLDCDLWETFYDTFKNTGDAKQAFNDALDAGLRGWREDRDYQNTDEYIDEVLIANEYEFTEEGKRI